MRAVSSIYGLFLTTIQIIVTLLYYDILQVILDLDLLYNKPSTEDFFI